MSDLEKQEKKQLELTRSGDHDRRNDRRLARLKKLPNILTVARMALVPVFVVLFYVGIRGWNYWAAGVFIVASATDLLDGMIARRLDCVSNFGKLMDPMADKLLVTAALLVLMEWGRLAAWVAIVIIAREFIISSFRLIAAERGVVIAAGKIGKIKTVTQLVGIAAMLLENGFFALIGVPFGEILIYASVVLSIWSCAEYIIKNKKVLEG